MRTILLSLCCLGSFCLQAQDIKKNAGEPEEYIAIRLSKFPIADLPKKPLPVSDIRIAQVVRDSVDVGYALKGMDNYVVNLKITKPLTDYLQEHIYRMYKDDFKKEGVKMFWLLKDIRMGEKTGFVENSYARFNLDGYVSADGVLFRKACEMDTVFVSESGGDVSKWHGDEVDKAFGVFSKRVLRFAKDALAGNGEQKTIAQILAQTNQDTRMPILTTMDYYDGAYKTFDEFLQNNPSIQNYGTVLAGKNNVRFTNQNTYGTVDTINIWGLCKSGELYKYNDGLLVAIEKKGNGFIVSDFIKNSNRRNRNVGFFSLIGGIAGGAIGGAAVGLAAYSIKNKILLVQSIPYISKPAKQPVASCIDMTTGEFSF